VSQDGVASQTDRSAPGKAWRLGLLVVAAGLATGIATQLGQSVLPDGWSQVANAISPWLVVAFLLGSRMPDRRWAALAGIAALVLALVGYYAMIELRYGYGASTSSLLLWGSAAVVGGPVFGIAGWSWRFDDGWHRAAAVGLLAACVIAEGAYLVVILLSRVVTRLGSLAAINPKVIEGLYATDVAYLQDLYNTINRLDDAPSIKCPSCRHTFTAEAHAAGG